MLFLPVLIENVHFSEEASVGLQIMDVAVLGPIFGEKLIRMGIFWIEMDLFITQKKWLKNIHVFKKLNNKKKNKSKIFKPSKFTCYDGYNLTAAAIKGEKTQRRVIAGWNTKKNGESVITPSTYEVGDELVLIQPYKDVPELAGKGLETEQGWKNKMFVKIENLPYKVRITNVRLERLHDISNEDALAEGVKTYHCDGMPNVYSF